MAKKAGKKRARKNPLDHDGDGKPGGMLPAAKRGLDPLIAEAAHYGVKVDRRWSAARIAEAIAATPAARLDNARAVADRIRHAWPAKAAEIDRAIEDVNSGKRDGITVKTAITYKLEKFEGEIEPGQKPFETIEGQG